MDYQIEQIKIMDIAVGERESSLQSIEGFEESMRMVGLINPIFVHQNDKFISEEETPEEAPYILIDGWYRLTAAFNLDWEKIECIVKSGLSNAEIEKLKTILNFHYPLLPIERIALTARLQKIYEIQDAVSGK